MDAVDAVHGMNQQGLDYVVSEESNSIGASLSHIAAIEAGFQIEVFDRRRPNEREVAEWGAAYSPGEQGRQDIHGQPLDFYLEKLYAVRQRTLEEFRKRDDAWLYEERLWENHTSNNYFIWFHTMEDELNHRGQIRILRKMVESYL